MQRQNINTVVCVVTVFIVLAVAALVILRDDSSSNSTLRTDSSSTGRAIQQFNNSSLLEHNTSITYPWTLTDSSNKMNNNYKEDGATHHHDRPISNFISITDIARGGIVTPITSTTRNNKCTDSNKSLMRFTLITDNYPVRFVRDFVYVSYVFVF